ncbi:MAG: NAD(P)H-hydrate epimerase [Candidatus Dormibacteria bacterium]
MDKLTSWRLGLSPDQMREVDRLAEADYGIAPVQLMEIAGLQTARVAREILGPDLDGRAVSILAGKGNNGADGLVAARRLRGWGARVQVTTSFTPAEATGLAAQHLRALRADEIAVAEWAGRLPVADLQVDALLGFGAVGAPRGAVAEMIETVNLPAQAGRIVLALDVPSGLDARTGEAPGAAVRAHSTVTLGVPKTGLLAPGASEFVGSLYLADIGIPPALLRKMGINTAGLFDENDLVRFP